MKPLEFDRWIYYMRERHNIYLLRQAGKPAPWTNDAVLSQYRFCNVYRELDKVTIWIREHIREPFADHPFLWFMLAIARRINLPATLAELIADKKGAWPDIATSKAGASVGKWNPDRMVQLLDDRTKRGEQVYTGAYMITGEAKPEHIGKTKSRTTVFSNLLPLWQKAGVIEPQLHHTLQGAFQALLGQGFAWGPFMCYEVVSDLRHTRYLCDAPDVLTWANAGLGALRGLNRLHGRPLKQAQKPDAACAEMQELLELTRREWPRPSTKFPRLEMREIEHTLCEFDKYMRVVTGEGVPRSKYRPPRNN
jgi:hypothetical protein